MARHRPRPRRQPAGGRHPRHRGGHRADHPRHADARHLPKAVGPMTKRTYGHTKSGAPVTDELIEHLAGEAERGYDVDRVIARRGTRGRPRLGAEPSSVESVRLDPELKALLLRRAED